MQHSVRDLLQISRKQRGNGLSISPPVVVWIDLTWYTVLCEALLLLSTHRWRVALSTLYSGPGTTHQPTNQKSTQDYLVLKFAELAFSTGILL
jgi:hypothetical protein